MREEVPHCHDYLSSSRPAAPGYPCTWTFALGDFCQADPTAMVRSWSGSNTGLHVQGSAAVMQTDFGYCLVFLDVVSGRPCGQMTLITPQRHVGVWCMSHMQI